MSGEWTIFCLIFSCELHVECRFLVFFTRVFPWSSVTAFFPLAALISICGLSDCPEKVWLNLLSGQTFHFVHFPIIAENGIGKCNSVTIKEKVKYIRKKIKTKGKSQNNISSSSSSSSNVIMIKNMTNYWAKDNQF